MHSDGLVQEYAVMDLSRMGGTGLVQWFLTWGKFTPGGKFHPPRGKIY